MGNNSSKPETKVFTPNTPIDFSSSFLAQLESSAESDYSRAQYTEKYIQERVAQELKKLEQETIEKFQQTTDSAISKDVKPQLSVESSNERVVNLTKVLQENIKLARVEPTSDIVDSRYQVLQCLKNNQGKPLNCWEEVEKFTSLVKDL